MNSGVRSVGARGGRPVALALSRLASAGLLAACLLATACIPELKQGKPRDADKSVPESFNPFTEAAASSSAQTLWKEFFDDDKLAALIEAAISKNQELNVVIQEINIADNEIYARRGEYLPKLEGGVGVGIDKVGKYTSEGAADANSEAPGSAVTVPVNRPSFGLGFRASWEIDIFKKLRNAAKSALYRYLGTIEGKSFMETRLVAEVANGYYELMALDNQLRVFERNLEIQTHALEVVRLQKQAARVTELAVQRFEAEVLKNQGRIFEVRQKIVEAENRINFTIGRFPQHIDRNSAVFINLTPHAINAGLPTDLLNNRPDIRRAELELRAAELDVEVARALYYPSLSLDARLGYESFNPAKLVNTPESLLYSIGASLTAPLFNRNAITANYFTANAKQMQAVYNYERTLVTAYIEAANQLSMIGNLRRSYELRSQQVERLTRAIEVSGVLFNSARADYLEVLTTRRDALEAQIELIETKKFQMNAVVNAYQALGGGWARAKTESTQNQDLVDDAKSDEEKAAAEKKQAVSQTAGESK